MSAKDLIRILQLEPHPEGGYFKETWRSGEKLVNARGATRNRLRSACSEVKGRI